MRHINLQLDTEVDSRSSKCLATCNNQVTTAVSLVCTSSRQTSISWSMVLEVLVVVVVVVVAVAVAVTLAVAVAVTLAVAVAVAVVVVMVRTSSRQMSVSWSVVRGVRELLSTSPPSALPPAAPSVAPCTGYVPAAHAPSLHE